MLRRTCVISGSWGQAPGSHPLHLPHPAPPSPWGKAAWAGLPAAPEKGWRHRFHAAIFCLLCYLIVPMVMGIAYYPMQEEDPHYQAHGFDGEETSADYEEFVDAFVGSLYQLEEEEW